MRWNAGAIKPLRYPKWVPACRNTLRDSDPEGVQERAHLRFGLGQLGVRVGVRHDAGTREKA